MKRRWNGRLSKRWKLGRLDLSVEALVQKINIRSLSQRMNLGHAKKDYKSTNMSLKNEIEKH